MVVLLNPSRDASKWVAAFRAELPDMDVELWPDVGDPDRVEFVVATRHDVADLGNYPNLRAVLAMGAGVEQYSGPLMPDVPVVRLADPAMSDEMAAYVVHWIVHFQRRMDVYLSQQGRAEWREAPFAAAAEYPVGILGFGTIGTRIAAALFDLGYPINAWTRTGVEAEWVTGFSGQDELDDFLSACAAVVNILPRTAATSGLLNAARFRHFRRGALLVNLGRGATTDEVDLDRALDDGQVGMAVLDVVASEPLDPASPLWTHEHVRITPHAAGFTSVPSASRLIAANIRRIVNGEQPFPMVDKVRGY